MDKEKLLGRTALRWSCEETERWRACGSTLRCGVPLRVRLRGSRRLRVRCSSSSPNRCLLVRRVVYVYDQGSALDKPAYLHTALRVYARSMCPLPLAKRKASPITALSGQMVPFGSSRVRCFEPGADNPPGTLLSWSPQNVVMRERISAKVVLCETETENSSPVEASTTVIFAICAGDY